MTESVLPSQTLDSEWIKETDLEDISALGAATLVDSQIPEWLTEDDEVKPQIKDELVDAQDILQPAPEILPQQSPEEFETIVDDTLKTSIPSQVEAPITEDNLYDEAAALAWLESLAAKQGAAMALTSAEI